MYGHRLVHVAAVEGQAAELPCDVSAPVVGDAVRLVLWYYGTEGTIYTYDARGRSGGASGSHWASGALGGDRLHFHVDGTTASLRISAVSRADGGVYRCRVDFVESPTQNSRVNLSVIVPPQRLEVLDSSDNRLKEDTIGPHRLGSSVNITCAAFDGSPPPNVTWWRGGTRLGGPTHSASDGSVRSPLRLGPLSRADHGARLTCMAAFHPFSSALTTSAVIRLFLPPESATIHGPAGGRVVAGQPVTLTCQVTGSEPAPVISWRLGSQPAPGARQQPSADGNGTVSELTFTPEVFDQGRPVTCSAANPSAGGPPVEDILPLHVQYPPSVSLTLRPERPLREGQTARLFCSVRAEPAVTQVRWKHEGLWLPELSPGSAETALNGSSELTLANVRANVSGNYTCQATSPLGTVQSQPVTLRVQYVPMCVSDTPTVLEAARGDSLNVSCHVASFPKPLRFRWSFNSSDALIPQREFSSSLVNGSTLSYTPQLPSEFGTLLCWATNELGEQRAPCAYLVQPADVPDPPSDCVIISRTETALVVRCQPGFDGGSRQMFRMEVCGTSGGHQRNVTSASARLRASGLEPGQQYHLSVYAVNRHGSSAAATLVASTAADERDAQQHHGSVSELLQLTPILGVLIGLVTALVLTAAILVGTRRCRARPAAKENPQEVSHVQLVNNLSDLGSMEEKHDPDLIPQKTECIDPEEKHMIERLRNSRFPPPPARFGDSSTLSPSETRLLSPSETHLLSPSETGLLSPTSRTLPRPERVSSCGTQTAPLSPRGGHKSTTLQLMRPSRRRSSSSLQQVPSVSGGHLLTKF
ncbi:nephrin-like [Amphibalanus amphitrite]|uniref:nephrin-like n=1 Tax=Amphibalanus amphitrite TaxID=1232801 RepID=UPI001C92AAFA|nr:nephrin-like [Amphibalanus amphitrite]